DALADIDHLADQRVAIGERIGGSVLQARDARIERHPGGDASFEDERLGAGADRRVERADQHGVGAERGQARVADRDLALRDVMDRARLHGSASGPYATRSVPSAWKRQSAIASGASPCAAHGRSSALTPPRSLGAIVTTQ